MAREALKEIAARARSKALAGAPEISFRPPTQGLSQDNYSGASISSTKSHFSILYQSGFDPLQLSEDEAELKIRKFHSYEDEHDFFRQLVRHQAVLGVVEKIVGTGAILFQTMALSKPPKIGTEKPWHQDNAYFNYTPLDQIVGVWIALDDATVDNGCMHVIPGGHRLGGLKHMHGSLDCTIVPDRLDLRQVRPVELPAGGGMFFYGMLPHQTPSNNSNLRRRALQLHYRGAETVPLAKQAYDRVFIDSDGSPASCAAASS